MKIIKTIKKISEEGTKFVAKLGIPGISTVVGIAEYGIDRVNGIKLDAKLGELSASTSDLKISFNDALEFQKKNLDEKNEQLESKIDKLADEMLNYQIEHKKSIDSIKLLLLLGGISITAYFLLVKE